METLKQNRKYLTYLIVVSVLALAVNVFIIVQSCLNGNQSTNVASPIVDMCKAIVNLFSKDAINDSNIDAFTLVIRKLFGHFGLYALSGLLTSSALLMWIKPLKWFKYYLFLIIDLSFGLLFSLFTELIQLFTPGRSGQILDSLIDFGGYIFGTLIILLMLYLAIRKRNKLLIRQ